MTLAYLATPYTNYPAGREAAFREAARIAAWLATNDIIVFCPIAHSHPLSATGLLPETDHDLWMKLDAPFVEKCDYCIVAKMDGWQESRGVTYEIAEFTRTGKSIIYIDPPK